MVALEISEQKADETIQLIAETKNSSRSKDIDLTLASSFSENFNFPALPIIIRQLE